MVKPIFVVQIPYHETLEKIHEVNQSLAARLPDYHVLVSITSEDEPKFSAFYIKDLVEADFEEFKRVAIEQIESCK